MFDINKISEKDLIRVEDKGNMFNKCKDIVMKNTKTNEDGKKELMITRSEMIIKFEELGLTNETSKNYYYLIVNKSGEYEKKENKRKKVEEFVTKFPNLTSKEYVKNFMNFFNMSESCARTYLQNVKKKIEITKINKQPKIVNIKK